MYDEDIKDFFSILCQILINLEEKVTSLMQRNLQQSNIFLKNKPFSDFNLTDLIALLH